MDFFSAGKRAKLGIVARFALIKTFIWPAVIVIEKIIQSTENTREFSVATGKLNRYPLCCSFRRCAKTRCYIVACTESENLFRKFHVPQKWIIKLRQVYDNTDFTGLNEVSAHCTRSDQREGFLLHGRSFFRVTNEMTIIRIAVAGRIFKGTSYGRVFLWKLKSQGGE